MGDLSLEDQNPVTKRTELIAQGGSIGQQFDPQIGPILAVYPDNTLASITVDGIEADGTRNGLVGKGPTGVLGQAEGRLRRQPGVGVKGVSPSDAGVAGESPVVGVRGTAVRGDPQDLSISGNGVEGWADAGNGVVGSSESGVGVEGLSGRGDAVQGFSVSGAGVYGQSDESDAIQGVSSAKNGSGVSGHNDRKSGDTAGVWGVADSPQGVGVGGVADKGDGVAGFSSAIDKAGVVGRNSGNPRRSTTREFGSRSRVLGVQGIADSGAGVGVLGASANGTGVCGEGGRYGGRFQGRSAQIYLVPASTSGPPKSGLHYMGELSVDANGDLFLCKKDGTPGTWVKVA